MSSATVSAFSERLAALVAEQKAKASAEQQPELERERTAWLVKNARLGNEHAIAIVGKQEPEPLDDDEAAEELDEHDEQEADPPHDDRGNADASYKEAGYIDVPPGATRVRG
jgi:hypothetical protein